MCSGDETERSICRCSLMMPAIRTFHQQEAPISQKFHFHYCLGGPGSASVVGHVKRCAAVDIIDFHNCIGWPQPKWLAMRRNAKRRVWRWSPQSWWLSQARLYAACNQAPNFAEWPAHAWPETDHQWHPLFPTHGTTCRQGFVNRVRSTSKGRRPSTLEANLFLVWSGYL